MDTFDQVKMFMKMGVGRPPMETSIECLLHVLTVINEDISHLLKDVDKEESLDLKIEVEIEADVMSLILACEEWLRLRYEKQFNGLTLDEEQVNRLSSKMILAKMLGSKEN